MPDHIATDSGIPVKASYDKRDSSARAVRTLGKPGEFPYTRGIYPNMYRERLWTMRQYTGFGSARETNLRLKYLISHGETGLSTAFDLPTQLGLDSDHPRAHGEVGKVGVAISSIDDMRRLFDGIEQPSHIVYTADSDSDLAHFPMRSWMIRVKAELRWKIEGSAKSSLSMRDQILESPVGFAG